LWGLAIELFYYAVSTAIEIGLNWTIFPVTEHKCYFSTFDAQRCIVDWLLEVASCYI